MVHRIVFDVELLHAESFREPMRAHERREAGVEARPRMSLDGQQLTIAPEALGPALDELAGEAFGDRLVVVGHLERAEALVAHPESGGGEGGLAEMAAKVEVHVREHQVASQTVDGPTKF